VTEDRRGRHRPLTSCRLEPLDEVFDGALERTMIIVRPRPVARAHELAVHAVDPTGVADEDVADLLLGDEFVNIHERVGYAPIAPAAERAERMERTQ